MKLIKLTTENVDDLLSNCFYLVQNLPLHGLPIAKRNILLRARSNEENQIFEEQQDISNNTTRKDKIGRNRFNYPTQSMFYAAVPGSPDDRHLLLTAALECCKELVDEKDLTKEKYFTFGIWQVKKSFQVINLCFHTRALDFNLGLKQNLENELVRMKAKMPLASYSFALEYWDFLSDLSSKKIKSEHGYFITNAFLNCIEFIHGSLFNGILYPSSMTERDGLNIVLPPETVEKHLVLEHVFMYKCIRDLSTKFISGDIYGRIEQVINKRFKFKFDE